jgi:hypothetical protein
VKNVKEDALEWLRGLGMIDENVEERNFEIDLFSYKIWRRIGKNT